MATSNSSNKGRTLSQVRKEVEQKRAEIEQKRNQIRLKKEKFLQENSNMVVFCKNCNKEYSIHEYVLIFRNKRIVPELQCKACKRQKNKEKMLRKVIERGY